MLQPSGAGPSGWGFERLRVLLDNVLMCNALGAACSASAEGSLAADTVPLMSASCLTVIPKKNGHVIQLP